MNIDDEREEELMGMLHYGLGFMDGRSVSDLSADIPNPQWKGKDSRRAKSDILLPHYNRRNSRPVQRFFNDQGPDVCFRCGEPGHMSYECTKVPETICFYCNERGHVSKECPVLIQVNFTHPKNAKLLVTCYNCGGKGHLGKMCSKRRVDSYAAEYMASSTHAAMLRKRELRLAEKKEQDKLSPISNEEE